MTTAARSALTIVAAAGVLAAAVGCAGPDPVVGPNNGASASVSVTVDAAPLTSAARPASTQELDHALLDAAAADDAGAVGAALARGANIEFRGAGGRTPLVAAAKTNAVNAARVLAAAGADVNAKDDMEDSAFLYAGAEGYDEILALTLAHGADVAATNRFGGTALIPASEHGHTSTVRTLIRAGVPVNHVNRPGWTALQEAVVYGDGSGRYRDVIGQLLEAGADPTIEDARGRTALQNAQSRDQDAVAALLQSGG